MLVKFMKKTSLWLDTIKEKKCSSLNQDLDVDVLVIGGGLTGLSLCYQLKDLNLNVCLVERNKIGHGVTSKTTGKLNYLQGIVYSKIQSDVSLESARMYLKSQKEGIEIVKNIIEKEQIHCNLEKVASFLYGTEDKRKKIEEEYTFLKDAGVHVEKEDCTLKVFDTYVFHPLKYLMSLKDIVKKTNPFVFENTLVTSLEKFDGSYQCHANHHIIKAKKVILACHYPFELFPFFLPVRTYIEKSYVMAFKTKENEHITSITTYPNIYSKRYHQEKEDIYEIDLSESHNICTKLNSKEHFRKLIQSLKPDYIWSNEDIMTADHLPFIGHLNEHLLLATGYNTWGMATSAIASVILKDLLLNNENEYAKFFDPYRKFNLAKLKQYPINIGSNIKSFTENKLCKKKSWYSKNLTFEMKNGKSVATYHDKNKSYSVYTTCPHVGCTLIFNEVEGTWDCPCHASRFDITGKCIKGPSLYDISYHEEEKKES